MSDYEDVFDVPCIYSSFIKYQKYLRSRPSEKCKANLRKKLILQNLLSVIKNFIVINADYQHNVTYRIFHKCTNIFRF